MLLIAVICLSAFCSSGTQELRVPPSQLNLRSFVLSAYPELDGLGVECNWDSFPCAALPDRASDAAHHKLPGRKLEPEWSNAFVDNSDPYSAINTSSPWNWDGRYAEPIQSIVARDARSEAVYG